jgi:hypothetical protein
LENFIIGKTKNRGQLASIERRIVERRREKRALAAANV